MTELDAARKFNEAVESTAVIGGLLADVVNLKDDVSEIKTDVKAFREETKGELAVIRRDGAAVRSTLDRYAGIMVVVGAIASLVASVIVAALNGALAKALGY